MLLRDPRNIAGAPGTQAFLDAVQPAPQPVGPAIGAVPQPRPVSIPRRQPAPAQQLMPLQQAVMNQMMRQSPMTGLREQQKQQQQQKGGMMSMLPGIDTPAGRGLAAAGARGLQLSGYQDRPITTGQVLGEMAAAGMKAYDTERKSQQASELAKQQRETDIMLKMMDIKAKQGETARDIAAKKFDQETKLADKYVKASKDPREAYYGYEKVRNAAEQYKIAADMGMEASGAADIALLIGYMKVLDPGSVVREGEFATARNAGGVPEAIRNLYNSVFTGQQLSQPMREDFIRAATSQVQPYIEQQIKNDEEYTSRAKNYNLDPDMVVDSFLPPRYESEEAIAELDIPAGTLLIIGNRLAVAQ